MLTGLDIGLEHSNPAIEGISKETNTLKPF